MNDQNNKVLLPQSALKNPGFKRVVAILAIAMVALVGCAKQATNDDESNKKIITIGVSQGPYNVLFDEAVKPILEGQGYTVNAVDFQDLLQSEIALNNNEIDFNVAQHTAYADNFNAQQKGRLVGITPIPTVPAGLYSQRYTTLDEIKTGMTIAIPNDPSNTARAYALLQKAGWITLKEGVDLLTASADDVIGNPYELKFVEMASLNIPQAMQDVDYAVITGSIVFNAKIDTSTVLLQEDILDDLMLVVVVNEEDKNTIWAKAIVDAYRSDAFKTYMNEHNQDNFWVIPTELQ